MSAPLHGTGRSRLSGDVQPAPHPSLQSFLDDHAGCHSDRGDGNTVSHGAKWGYDPTAQHFTPLGALFHEGRLAKRS